MPKTIIIKHVSGVYKLPVKDEFFNSLKIGIRDCIVGKIPFVVYIDSTGNESHFPATLLQNSVITYEEVKRTVKVTTR